MAKLVSCVRAKNALHYLPRLLPQLRAISDEVVILDDYSTDGTYEYLSKETVGAKGLLVLRQGEQTYDGGRDWNIIYEYVERLKPDWLFCPDTDELVEEGQAYNLRKLVEQSGKDILGWSFPFYYLWNDEQHYRDDGMYHNTRVIRLFRYDSKLRPPKRISHSTGLPDELDRRMIRVAPIRMVHFGYMLENDRKAKYEFYNKRDADPMKAGAGSSNYDHMLQMPKELKEIVSFDQWSALCSPREYGNFLTHAPQRACVGAPFPTATQASNLLSLSTQHAEESVDEVRISFCLDGVSTDVAKDALDKTFQILRPGGRLEVVAIDFKALCKKWAEDSASVQERYELQPRFFQTPLREPIKTMFFEDLLTQMMGDAGYCDWQRIPLPDFPYRLYCIAYKPGPDKWI